MRFGWKCQAGGGTYITNGVDSDTPAEAAAEAGSEIRHWLRSGGWSRDEIVGFKIETQETLLGEAFCDAQILTSSGGTYKVCLTWQGTPVGVTAEELTLSFCQILEKHLRISW